LPFWNFGFERGEAGFFGIALLFFFGRALSIL